MSAHQGHRFGEGGRPSPHQPTSAADQQGQADLTPADEDLEPTGEHEPRLPWEQGQDNDREGLARSKAYPANLPLMAEDSQVNPSLLDQIEAPVTTVEPAPGYASSAAPAAAGYFESPPDPGLSSECDSAELESEPTRVEREEDLRAGMDPANAVDGPLLLVIGGNNRGTEYPLKAKDNSLGRGMDNDIILADIAVSRKHTLVCYEGGQYVVRDLGSGNGTLLNGQRVESSVLKDGDQLELGNTLLRLVYPPGDDPPQIAALMTVVKPRDQIRSARATGAASAAARPRKGDRPPSSAPHLTSQLKLPLRSLLARLVDSRPKKIALFGVLGLVALFGLLATVKALLQPSPPRAAIEVEQALPPDEIVAQEFNAGITEYNAQSWGKAKDHFLKALAIAPTQDHVRQYVDKATAEISARDALEVARQLLEEGAFDKSRQAIAKISTSSVYHRKASSLAQQVDDKQVQALIEQVKTLAEEDGKEGEVQELLKRAQAISPTSPQVRALSEAQSKRPRRQKLRVRGGAPRAVSDGSSLPPSRSVAAASGPAVKTVLSRYRQKEWGPAYEAMRQHAKQLSGKRQQEATALADAIRLVGQSWIRAEQSTDLGQRIEQYHKASQADQRVPGKPHQSALREKIVSTAKAQAATALSRGQYPAAFTAVKLGQKYGGNDDSFRKVLAELERKAQETFNRGYTLRTQNLPQARVLWQQVLRMVPPASPTYQKAYSWLNNASPSYQDEDEE